MSVADTRHNNPKKAEAEVTLAPASAPFVDGAEKRIADVNLFGLRTRVASSNWGICWVACDIL